MVDETALFSLSYGLYVVAAKDGDRRAGCIVNTVQQVTATPIQVSVAVNKENVTTDVILNSGRFTVSCLAQDAPMELIGTFGFHTSADTDKFASWEHALDEKGAPYLTEHSVAHVSVRVTQIANLGTHMLFIGEVEEAEKLNAVEPMTYAYYHQIKRGKTPPKASSYLPNASDAAPAAPAAASAQAPETAEPEAKPKYGWRCKVCGYIEYVDELPEGFTCPVCGVGPEMFERIEL